MQLSGGLSEMSDRVKWFSRGVTVLLIVGCNGILLGGLWASGINLEIVLSQPELFDPSRGACVGVAWVDVVGADRPLRLCSEWLDFRDISGNTHKILQHEVIAMKTDGQLYYRDQHHSHRQVAWLVGSVIFVMGGGMWVKHSLIRWYRTRVERGEGP